MVQSLVKVAREAAGLSKTELAARAETSRPTLSAYEHGRVSPTLVTLDRILAAAGHRLVVVPVLRWREVEAGGGRTAAVPDALPTLSVRQALRIVDLPLHLDWSRPERKADLADRSQRAQVYETVLREGRPEDIEALVDATLLVDLWDDLVLPRQIRSAWQPLIDEARRFHV